ncbi:MAG: hypothetical protein ACXVA9_09525 [Bdellovibrionales bacterium]
MAQFFSRIFLVGSLIFVTASCSHKTDSNKEGGQDGGGGHVARSTPEQVHKVLDQALRLASATDTWSSVFSQWAFDLITQIIINPELKKTIDFEHVFPVSAIVEPPHRGILRTRIENYESPYIHALSTNRIIIKETGDCGSAKDNHADASVSALQVDADICFSIDNLTRIPTELLLREILALVIHEVSHLGGAEEAEAQQWQNLYRQYYKGRFGDIDPHHAKLKSEEAFQNSLDRVQLALRIQKKTPNDPRVYSLVGQALEALSGLPATDDPILLEITFSPERPWLTNGYLYSVVSIKVNTAKAFGLPYPGSHQSPDFDLPDYDGRLTGKALSAHLAELAKHILILANDYTLLTGNPFPLDEHSKPSGKFECIHEKGGGKYTCAEDIPPKDAVNRHLQ